MEEVEVVKKTFDYLTEKLDYRIWIDNHPSYASLPINNYPRHKIPIKGFIPDLIGFNQFDEVIAVEAKGTKDIQKGIGQALLYKEGAHTSYLAADRKYLERVKNVLMSHNIGAIFVSTDKVETTEPPNIFLAKYLQDTQRELNLLTRRISPSEKRLTSLNRNNLVNYLAPLVVVKSDSITKQEVIEGMKGLRLDESKFPHLIKGAKTIGLIKDIGDGYVLTDEGFLIKTILKTQGRLSIQGLNQMKERLGSKKEKRSIYTEYKELATCLRMVYNQNTLFRELIAVLEEAKEKRISFQEMIKKVISDKPNLFLNLFCKERKKEEALLLYQQGEEKEIYEEKDKLREFVMNSAVFTFKKHLIHLGILATNNKIYNKSMKTYNPEKDKWILD